jgi:hypothetical protein
MPLSAEEAQWLVVFMRSLPGSQGAPQAQEVTGYSGFESLAEAQESYNAMSDYYPGQRDQLGRF